MALRTLAATRQELELIVQPGEQARHSERRTASRRQLDRERHPIEASTQLRDLGCVVVERGIDRSGPLHEQRCRVRVIRTAVRVPIQ